MAISATTTAQVRPDAPAKRLCNVIDILPTATAQMVAHAHTALLCSGFLWRFPALVANPVATLLGAIVPLIVLQTVYVVVCLPAAGSDIKTPKRTKPAGSKKVAEESSNTPVTVLLSLLLALLAIPVVFAMQILMGAPLTTHTPHTLLTSTHFALLAVYPLVYVHGAEGARWRELVALWCPVDGVFGAAVGGLVGAWFGAVPIPLDWDREWQKWPVTIVCGLYAGCVLGKLLGAFWLRGKRIELD